VTFVDLGLALVLGWLWIAWREASAIRAVVWLVLTAVTGSGALLVYVALAAWRAQDMRDVLIGPARAA
jgi:cell division septal protein FtsQ